MMLSMSSPQALSAYHSQPEAKRRKLRKGTHSCWECKRRKMKCVFDQHATATTCNGCRRRGSLCMSQEVPEEELLAMDQNSTATDGIVRVGALQASSNRIAHDRRTPATTPSEDGRTVDHSIPTAMPISSESSRYLAFYKSSEQRTVETGIFPSAPQEPASQGKYDRLSRFLHESLPSREDTERICKASRHPSVLSHEIMTMPYATFDQDGLKTHESLLDIPEPTLHPVLISRHMLLLASFLQHLQPDRHKEIKDLSESPRAIMERLADLAISLVTTNDDHLGSIEGLGCVMIESLYQANIGNLRRSWVANRRAMSIAQLMGLHRPDSQTQYKVLDPKTKYHPQLMWFRIVFLDRYLCLMLGLSQGSLDRSMASDSALTNDTPIGRLERIHCVVASKILERNESNPSSYDLDLTRTLDVELQKAARSLPGSWWLAPNLATASNDSQTLFSNTRRLLAQVFHYNLLNQLHLPYMLRSSSAERNYEYSLITCVNASREVLSRFITLRSFNQIAYSCRTIDFLALMAAMTLLLAYLDSHRSEAENLLGHQYHSDRAMIERVQENMKGVNRLNSDALSAQSANLLSRLMAIGVETADTPLRCARRVSVQKVGTETALLDQDDSAVISVHIPYFGVINISCNDMRKEISKPQATLATTNRPAQLQRADKFSTAGTDSLDAEPQINPYGFSGSSGIPSVEAMTPVDASYSHVELPSNGISDGYTKTQAQLGMLPLSNPTSANDGAAQLTPQLGYDFYDPVLQHGEYPDLAATGKDWAFQGADMAFFENLMRSTWS